MKTIAIVAIIIAIVLIASLVFLSRKEVSTPTTTTVIPQTTITPTTTPTEELSMLNALEGFGDLADGVLDISTDTDVIVGELESESFELTL